MLNIVLLTLTTVGISLQAILQKEYNRRTGSKGPLAFSAISVLCACLFFLFSSGFDLNFTAEILPYAFGFALSYGTAVLMTLLAIKVGSLSLTSLVTSYSLIVPTLYGLVFLKEDVGILFFIGLAVLCVSLFLMNSKHSESRITPIWILFAFLAFAGNGACSTVVMVQQKAFNGQYRSELMIIALLTVSAVMICVSRLTEKGDIGSCVKRGAVPAILYGIVNGLCNFMAMILAVRMNASVMYPIISAGGIVLSGIVSAVFYKERLSRGQYAALMLGVVSVVLMNI